MLRCGALIFGIENVIGKKEKAVKTERRPACPFGRKGMGWLTPPQSEFYRLGRVAVEIAASTTAASRKRRIRRSAC